MADFKGMVGQLREGTKPAFPPEANQLEFAKSLDQKDEVCRLRDQFIIPKRSQLKIKALGQKDEATFSNDQGQECIYFCGNSLGLQPKAISHYQSSLLETWASIGVYGHFTDLQNSPLVAWQDMAEDVAKKSASLVGASPSEVVIMNTLTVNLHLMMASFYKPTPTRHKIICEWRPFPSDFYAIESQIQWHGLEPSSSMVLITPDEDSYFIPTAKILAVIDENAADTALLLLPGIQYYSGQLLDIPTITAYAKARGITVGWDLAHAAGNVELALHDWDVDFACWCTYKYINAGPGSIAGAFVHAKHGGVDHSAGEDTPVFRERLTGWYGGDKSVRFRMDNKFKPTPGAAGYQISNPSIIDLASLSGALSLFNATTMSTLRSKSLLLTAYAEHLLIQLNRKAMQEGPPAFRIITPSDPLQRGAQLSVLLRPGLLEDVGAALKGAGIVCDQRKPDVARVAPVPLYNTFEDVWWFMQVFSSGILKQTSQAPKTQQVSKL